MEIEAKESPRSTSTSIILSEEQMKRVDVPGDESCLFWAVALPYLIQVNNNLDLFRKRFERLFGEKELIHSHHVRHLINEFHTSHNDKIYDDEILRTLVTQMFRNKLTDHMGQCEGQFYNSISIDDFKDMKNESFITDGTFRNSFENNFSLLIKESDVDVDRLKPEILDKNTIAVINGELDKIVKLGRGDLLQKFKFRMYLEAIKSSSSWGGVHEIEIMKGMLECEILVNFENFLVSARENSIICLFNNQQIYFQFFLIKAQFLIEFINRNSEEKSLKYLKIGVDEINFQNSNGSTLLHFAAKNNHEKSIHALINQGADINVRNNLGQTPLDVAIALNSQSFIAALREISAINKKIETVEKSEPQTLLEYNEDGRNIIHVATEEGNDVILKQILSWLVEDGHLQHTFIDIPARGERKQTALHLAAKNNRVNEVDILIENKANVNVRDVNSEGRKNWTPLHYAAEKGHLDIVKLLIEKGKSEIDAPDRTKGTPLQRAVRFGQLSVVKYLVEVGADVNSRDQTSISVLSYAAKAGCLQIVGFLLEKGAEINAMDKNSITPLHHAANSSKWDIVKYLVERGADPNIESNEYKTPLNRIVLSKQLELASVLMKKGALTNDLSEKQLQLINRKHDINISKDLQINKLLNNLVGSERLEVNKHSMCDFLPEVYDELMLLSVPISHSVGLFIESEIINCRLFSDRKVNEFNAASGNEKDVENIKLRMNLVVKAIEKLEEISANLGNNKISDAFLFVGRFIAQNMEILKRQLLSSKYSVAKLPWTQMQFCLVNFISAYLEPKQSDDVYKLATNKARLAKNLRKFKDKLEVNIDLDEDYTFDFNDLYEDYELLRDIYSLNRIEQYLNPACVVDLSKKNFLVGEQVILRALQVTGECLKNTIETPNMSDKVHHLLITLAPKNVIKFVTSLRDSLSPVEHLQKWKNAKDQASLSDIQKDLIKLKEEINYLLSWKRNLVVIAPFERISECEMEMAKEMNYFDDESENMDKSEANVNCILQTIFILENVFESEMIKEEFFQEIEIKEKVFRSKNILLKYCSKIVDIYNFFKIFSVFYNTKKEEEILSEENKRFVDELLYRFNLRDLLEEDKFLLLSKSKGVKDEVKVAGLIDELKLTDKIKQNLSLDETQFRALIDNLQPDVQLKLEYNEFQLSKCKTILNSLKRIDGKVDSYGKLVKDLTKKERKKDASKKSETDKLSERFNEFIASLIGDKKSQIFNSAVQKLVDKRIINKLLNDELKKYFFEKLQILTKIFHSEKSDLKLLSLLKTDDNIRIAVEMLVLNLTETLDQLSLFEKNRFHLDECSPVLVGKNLRKYLAHGDPLINILPTSYLISLITHFRLFQSKFHKEGAFYSGEYLIGKVTIENVLEVEELYQQNLAILDKKYNLFNIIKTGEIDDFNKLISNSLYLKVRNFLGDTFLHFSARANNLSVFQHLLKQGSNLFLKNKYGHSALYLAVSAGSERIIEFLLRKSFDPSFIVRNGETSLHLAVAFGQLGIVKLLLKYGADIAAQNNDGERPIILAVRYGNENIVTELINAGSDLEWTDKSGATLVHLATTK